MSGLLYSDMTYCSLCDRYFPGDEARAQHVQLSLNHPKCDRCNRRFANKNSLRNHWVYSPRHHYCAVCEKDFRTGAGLRVHIEYAAVHRDDSDDDSDDDDDLDDSHDGWEDDMGQAAFPEENERPPSEDSDDDSYSEQEEYWDEDDETEFEEEREAYYGFAATPRHLLRSADSSDSVGGSGSGVQNPPVVEFEISHSSTHHNGETPSNKEGQNSQEKVQCSRGAFSCPLCLEPAQETSATRCGHLFCTPCIIQALAQKKLCPVCRKGAGRRQLRKIYLS